jgi:hypothetical protein
VASQGWRETAADQLSQIIGRDLWAGLNQSWRAGKCIKLAAIAKRLQTISGSLNTLDDKATLVASGPTRLARAARMLLRRAVSLHLGVTQAVHGLRFAGIALCALHGELDECQCLKDTVDEIGLPQLQTMLETALLPYFTQ